MHEVCAYFAREMLDKSRNHCRDFPCALLPFRRLGNLGKSAMHLCLRICGGVGLSLCVLVIVVCGYISIQLDRTIRSIGDQASQSIEAAREHVTDVKQQLNALNSLLANAMKKEAEQLDPAGIEAIRKFETTTNEVKRRIAQVTVALEKTAALTEVLNTTGLSMDGHRIDNLLEKTGDLEGRLDKLSAQLKTLAMRFQTDGTIREAIVDETKERTLVALERVLLPAGILVEEINQVASTANDVVTELQSRFRWIVFFVTSVVVLIMSWMALGQLALMRNGLKQPPPGRSQ